MKLIVSFFVSFLVLVGLSGCQTKPTKVYETEELKIKGRSDFRKKLHVSKNTVVIDTRSPFNYSLAHIKGAINLNVFDFYQKGEVGKRGLLKKDLYFLTRRLARYGVSPQSEVVVVGEGISGEGLASEFQLAWVLYHLGVKEVQYSAAKYFRFGWSNSEDKPRKSVRSWKPKLQKSVLIDEEELEQILGSKNNSEIKQDIKILDVRSSREFQSLNNTNNFGTLKKSLWGNLPVLQIEWRRFFTELGRPNPKVLRELKKIGVKSTDRIVVVSNRGIRSAAVTMSLLDLGFLHSGNYSAGYESLL